MIKEQLDEKEIKHILDKLYGKLCVYNDKLMRKSEDTSKYVQYSFNDIFDFYITSHAQLLVKDVYLGNGGSPGTCLSARCVLEGLALKRMYERGDISDKQIELLQYQVFLIEYKQYEPFVDIADKILLPEKLKLDYEAAKQIYYDKLINTYAKSEIEKIVKSKIPFLCDPTISYYKLVKEYLGEEYSFLYSDLSAVIHPGVAPSDSEYIVKEMVYVLLLCYSEYKDKKDLGYSLSEEISNVWGDIGDELVLLFSREAAILSSIENLFAAEFGQNYVSKTFHKLALLLNDMPYDKSMGLTEQIKCKWKVMLELFAAFEYVYFERCGDELLYKLLVEHRYATASYARDKSYSCDKAYEIYCEMYDNPCEKEKFNKVFLTSLGFSINASGQTLSITQLVKNYVKQFDSRGSRKEDEISLQQAMYLDYIESQMLSHANGYMWFANSGAWGDVYNIFVSMQNAIIMLLNKLHVLFNCTRIINNDDKSKYRSIINLLRNSKKRIEPIAKRILEIMRMPTVRKYDVK